MANATSDQWPQTSLIPHGEPPATEIWGKLQKLTVQDNARLGWVYIRYTLHELYVGEARFPRQIPWARGLADSSASVSDTATPRSSAAFCLRQRLIPPVEQAYRYRNAGVLADRSKANRQAMRYLSTHPLCGQGSFFGWPLPGAAKLAGLLTSFDTPLIGEGAVVCSTLRAHWPSMHVARIEMGRVARVKCFGEMNRGRGRSIVI